MRKNLVLLIFISLATISLLISLLYFSNPQYRKEKIESYREKMEHRFRRSQ